MKIVGVFLNPEIRTGGHRRYLEFFQSAADKKNTVHIITNKKLDYPFTGISEIKVEYDYSKRFIPYSLVSFFRLWKNKGYIKKSIESCDFIVIHGETHLFAGIYLKKLLKSKLLFALRSNDVVVSQIKRKEPDVNMRAKLKLFLAEFISRSYEKIISKNADLIAFQSSFDKESFCNRNRRKKLNPIIIPGNIEGKWFNPVLEDSNHSERLKSLIYVGALNERKGIKYLVSAFIKLSQIGYDLDLKIAGTGTLEAELKQMVNQNRLEEKVQFLGKIKNPVEYIAKADLMIVPSIFDSFPDVILESLHTGTPVIAAKSGGIPDMLAAEDLFDIADSNAIVDKISDLYENRDHYMSIKSRQGMGKKKFKFDWAQAFIDEMNTMISS